MYHAYLRYLCCPDQMKTVYNRYLHARYLKWGCVGLKPWGWRWRDQSPLGVFPVDIKCWSPWRNHSVQIHCIFIKYYSSRSMLYLHVCYFVSDSKWINKTSWSETPCPNVCKSVVVSEPLLRRNYLWDQIETTHT